MTDPGARRLGSVGVRLTAAFLAVAVLIGVVGALAVRRQLLVARDAAEQQGGEVSRIAASVLAREYLSELEEIDEEGTGPEELIEELGGIADELAEVSGEGVAVVDGHGRALVSSGGRPLAHGAARGAVARTLRGGRTRPFAVPRDGATGRFAAAPMRDERGRVVGAVVVEYTELHDALVGTARANARLLAAASAGALLLALVLGLSLASRITRPLLRLQHAMRATARGNLGERVEVAGPDEIASLAASFNAMADELARAAREREQLLAASRNAAREIAAQNERLRELDRLKDSFVASVSHELRTPVTSIRGYLDLVLDGEAGDVPDEQRRFLAVVNRNAERLVNLVDDLLMVAQMHAGSLALEHDDVHLGRLLAESAEAARPAAEAKGVELVVDAEPVPPLRGDLRRLAQVLDNLVSNAIKFTPRDGTVELRLATEGGLAALEVADTGIGISPDDVEHVFERFFRASAANDLAVPGTGLGLAITRAIVEAHGGSIAVESSVGAGSTFRVELPLDGAPVSPAAREEAVA